MPRPDFPKSILEFQQWFPDEEACIKYLYESRWPDDGFICPVCGDNEAYYIKTRRVFQCKANMHQTYLTAGTVMEGSHTPLTDWFWAAYLMTTVTPGISAIQLERQLGLRHETAFNILHKLRSAMVNPERTKIKGKVEVDETYVGGPTTGGKRGRGTEKAIVIVAVERKNNHAGRVRLRHIENVSGISLIGFIKDVIVEGSTIITDDFPGYTNISRYGYRHKIEEDLRLAHLVISNLKTWIRGIFHGVSDKHLQAYLNEYTFRFNRRKTPMAAFQTILGLTSRVEDWPTYEGLYSGEYEHPNPE